MCFFFVCNQKTAYEMRIRDWSSDVCSSDLVAAFLDIDALDFLAGRAGLVGDEDLAEQPLGRRPRIVHRFHHLDAAGLAAAPGVDLGLDDPYRSAELQIGRASCRERGCQYVEISWVAV